MWLGTAAGLVVAQPSEPPEPAGPPAPSAPSEAIQAPPADDSWLDRTLRRYFRNDTPTGSELGGQAVELTDRYARFAGRRIAVVIVHQVDRLRPDDASRGELMSSLARTMHPYARESVLRQYLRVRQGEPVDPLKLADTERLLRGIEYVADVRLHVVPLTGDDDEVAVVVEVRDRLPVGASLYVRDIDRYEAGLFHSNLGGLDLRMAVDLLYRQGVSPETGWGVKLRKRNIRGSFIDAELGHEDSWRGLTQRISLTRVEAHPDIRWVGGVDWRKRLERDPSRPASRTIVGDGWLGRVIRRRGSEDAASGVRPVLVPALGYAYVHHDRRPDVTPDSNLVWHENRQLLAGLTWSRTRDYRTSFLNGLGETENLSGGQGLKLSLSYVDGEFRDRTGVFLQSWRQSVRRRGEVTSLRLDLGTYLRDGAIENGAIRAAFHYVSRARGSDRWRSRLLFGARFHRSIRPVGEGPLTLSGGLGPRGFDLPLVAGDTRLVVDAEWRVFAPWALSGFRCQLFAFADAGLLSGQGSSLTDQPLLASTGLGLRVGNPELVLPVIEVRVAFLRGMDDNAAGIVFVTENFSAPGTSLPGSRPGSFEFR